MKAKPLPPTIIHPKTAEGSLLAIIERSVSNPRLDVSKMQRLLDMHLQIVNKKAEMEYNSAMCEVQQETQPVAATAYNDHTKSYYAKLEAIDDAIRPVYTKAGFSLTTNSETLPDGRITAVCEVRHIGGHKSTHSLTGALDNVGSKGTLNKTNIQGLGSTISYLRRYLTCMIFNVVIKGEDKDGNKDKQEKQPDEFAAKVQSEIIDNEQWDGKIHDGSRLEEEAAKLKTLLSTGRHHDRVAILNKHIPLLQQLSNAGYRETVSELHSLVDKGK